MNTKMQYGIRKLVLLNSGGYSRGEFPLDRPVSISGSNNMGKSTAINALQFPFLCDRRYMDFPASDKDTLQYYFPTTNSYVLSEIVTETGTFVVGAAGKGAIEGHEFQLFAYKKGLDIENDLLFEHTEFANKKNIRTLSEFESHLGIQNVWLKKLRPREMQEVLAGREVTIKNEKFTIGVFRLKHINNLPLFMEIFKNLLHMNDFDMEKMKMFLLNSLLPNWEATTRNFIKTYRYFDNEVKSERAKIDAAESIIGRVRELIKLKKEWDDHFCFLSTAYKSIELRYESEKKARTAELSLLKNSFSQIDEDIDSLKKLIAQLTKKNHDISFEKKKIEEQLTTLQNQEIQFKFFSIKDIKDQIRVLRKQEEDIIAKLALSSDQTPDSIKRKIKDKNHYIKTQNNLLKGLESNLLFLLKDHFKKREIQNILKLLNKEIFTEFIVNDGILNIHDERGIKLKLKKLLSYCDGNFYNDGNVVINLESITPIDINDYLNHDKIQENIKDAVLSLNRLQGALKTAENRQEAKQKKNNLEKKIRKKRKLLDIYQTFLTSLESKPVLEGNLSDITGLFEGLAKEISTNEIKKEELVKQSVSGEFEIKKKEKELRVLGEQKQMVRPIIDFEGNLPSDENFDFSELSKMDIKELVNQYIATQRSALNLKNRIKDVFEIIERGGGRRFATGDDIPAQIESLKDNTDANAIEKNKELLRKIRESHSIQIGAILKQFTGKLEEFKNEIRTFNREMNKRPISNIKRIEFFIDENNKVLKTIQKLEKVDSLFVEGSSSRMIQNLTQLVEGGESISLPNLFNLGIRVELLNGKKPIEAFGQTKIESNGTDLTVKVVLNVMLLKRILHQKPDQVLNIPAYIDEAGQIDTDNQNTLIKECSEAGFIPVFASVEPQDSAFYWIGLNFVDNKILVTPDDWWTLENEKEKEHSI